VKVTAMVRIECGDDWRTVVERSHTQVVSTVGGSRSMDEVARDMVKESFRVLLGDDVEESSDG
jgi:hypothetical protein